jgi:hypothetical protein
MASRHFPARPSVLLDTREAVGETTPDQLRLRAEWIATLLSRNPATRAALVPDPVPASMAAARILAGFLETLHVSARVFPDIQQARDWLAEDLPARWGNASL